MGKERFISLLGQRISITWREGKHVHTFDGTGIENYRDISITPRI